MYNEDNDLVAFDKKREAAHPTKEEVLAVIEDILPSLLGVTEGQWNEYTGSMILSEDQWGRINDAAKELEDLLGKFKK